MKTGAGFSDNSPCVATIGFFDGVHRGHRCLIDQVRSLAAARGLPSAAVTFPVHPRKVMQQGFCPELLTTCDEKVALLAAAGIDRCVMLDFTPQLALLSARRFMALLKERYGIVALVIGYDHRFGHNRSEGFDDYVRYGAELGIEVVQARAFSDMEEGAGADLPCGEVSSSCIRQLLRRGDVSDAARCLGYDYFLQGTVVGGHRVGHTLGFPTANLRVDDADKLVPADGVYAVRVAVDGQTRGGMLSIGFRPTLANGTDRSIEVYIFDFHADIYSHPLRLSFVSRVRDELKFASLDELVAQLRKDEETVRRILNSDGNGRLV